MRNPTEPELACCIGLLGPIDPNRLYDVIVVGAGPAGLATAVYAVRKDSRCSSSTAVHSAARPEHPLRPAPDFVAAMRKVAGDLEERRESSLGSSQIGGDFSQRTSTSHADLPALARHAVF